MSSPYRALRTTLAFVFLLSLYFSYMMLFDPSMLMEIYDVSVFDAMHSYFSMVAGAMLTVIAIGAALAFLQPVKYANIVMLLVIYHLARFVVDVILLAQGQILIRLLLPEMVYFLFMCAALIRYFPVRIKKPEEEDPESEKKKPESEPKKPEVTLPPDLKIPPDVL